MASQLQGLFSRFSRTRYLTSYLPSSVSLVKFSTLQVSSNHLMAESTHNQIKTPSNLNEHDVLDKLSDLLPIRGNTSIPKPFAGYSPKERLKTRAIDGFLSPEEKLRGVFIQRLKGRAAIELALTNVGVDLTIDIVSEVVNRGNLGGEAMVIFFNWAVKQPTIPKDADTYNVIIKALGRRKFIEFMVEVLKDMQFQGISPNSETLSIVLDGLIKARNVSKAMQMFRNLEEFGGKCDTESLNVLLQCLCRRSHVGAANSFFNAMKGEIPFNCMTYNAIIGGWSKYGKIDEIEKCFKAMVADGCSPSCLTFSHLIEALGRAGRIDDAVEVFHHMEEKGCVPDADVYNALISNFISIGDLNGSMKYYNAMVSGNCGPNVNTYTKLINAFLKARKVADALEMLDEMVDRGMIPTTGDITSFIEPLCQYGPPYAAMMFYKKARKVGCKISLRAYKLLLMRLSRFGKCGMLLNLWDEMQESGYSSDTEVYEHVINGLCNIGQLETAVLVMEESLHKGFCPSRLIWSKLNNKLLDSGKVERAYKLFLKIKVARQNDNARRFWRAKGWHF